MISRIIRFSIYNKFIVALFVLAVVGLGIYNLAHLPLDAVPDITDNQVQIITSSPDLSAQEVERLVTYPLEMELGNIPRVDQIRSISRFGLSVITIVFDEGADIYWAREQINQKLQKASSHIPAELGEPEMGPISTGLGEIYQYVIYADNGYEDKYNATELRSIQDWIIKRQLIGIPGVVEINSSGGFLKQYEIALDQARMKAYRVPLGDIFNAVAESNSNSGGSYIEKENQTFFIRGEGMARSLGDLENIVVKKGPISPVLIKHLADVRIGHAPRFGAVTMDGRGEVVAGQVMMLKGENSMEVTKRVKERIGQIKNSLPEGIVFEPYLDRSKLINRTTYTISKNLIEGALIVIFILVLLLGNFRAGLIVASVIPISMLFAVSLMKLFGVSANLMSLGAIDFGLIVDGAVIIVEAVLHQIGLKNQNKVLSESELQKEILLSSTSIRKSAAFGEIIILIVYVPIFFLQGVEGKMFVPMAQTVSFAILGALILSVTYVPMMSDLLLRNAIPNPGSLSARIMRMMYRIYSPVRELAFRFKYSVLVAAILLFVLSLWIFSKMGSEFIPTLEEGDFALHQILPPGSSIKKGVEVSGELQKILTSKFPEVEKVVTKIGTAEIPTDIMPLEAGDIFVIMKPKKEWVSAASREEMFDKMEEELNKFPGVMFEFTQPIQMRFNELMTGVRQDIAIKIYGDDLGVLIDRAHQAERILQGVSGIGDVKVEATAGLQQMLVDYDLEKMAKFGVTAGHLNDVLKASFAGKHAGFFYEGERQYSIVVRLRPEERQGLQSLEQLMVDLPNGAYVPMSELASISFEEGPTQISRDNTKRRITLGVNARNIDIATLINSIQNKFTEELELPAGYHVEYGGQFENLLRARKRLSIVVPIALCLIFIMLYFNFNSLKYALLIYVAIPLSAIGGIWSLYFRSMPFSISAGVGFIALFGVAVLNGIVLVAYFNQLKKEGMTDLMEIIRKGTKVRLRPVIMTAAVASLGFLPMALSRSAGAEVQQPLATVVIGGLIAATILTLIVLPILYYLMENRNKKISKSMIILTILLFVSEMDASAQDLINYSDFNALITRSEQLLVDAKETQKSAYQLRSNSPVTPNLTSISFSSEEFNFEDALGIQSINLRHNFRSPKSRAIGSAFYGAQSAAVEQQFFLQSRLRRQHVIEGFIEAAYLTSLVSVEENMLGQYRRYMDLSNRKIQLGEVGGLEGRQVAREYNQSELRLRDAENQLQTQLKFLSNWTGAGDIMVVPLSELDLDMPTLDRDMHPSISSWHSRREIAVQRQNLAMSKINPRIFSGLQLQRLDGSILFFGFELGISVSLDQSYKKDQSEALMLDLKAIDDNIKWVEKQIDIDLERLISRAGWQKEISENLFQQINVQEKLIGDLATAYRLGEANYSEIIIGSEKYRDLQVQYLNALRIYFQNLNKLTHHVYK